MASPIVTTHCMYFFGLSRSILSFDPFSGSGGGGLSDDDIAVIAARLVLGNNALHQFHAQLKEPSALQQAGAAPVVLKFLQALHCDT